MALGSPPTIIIEPVLHHSFQEKDLDEVSQGLQRGGDSRRDLNEKFWSTKDPGQKPFQFELGMGRVIKGWDEGVMSMSIGEIARLKCSPDYAYGSGGFPAWGIMPNSVLVFEIEVLSAQ